MRTEERWLQKIRADDIKQFTPRIQKDLQKIPTPKDIPTSITDVFMYGITGTGKTIRAAFMLLQEQKNIYLAGGPINRFDKCAFITMPELTTEIKDTYNTDAQPTEKEVIEYYQNIHLLVLDDFGTVKPTDWVLQILYLIINHRYEYCKTTIFTSNLNLTAIATLFEDDRITSRIERMCQIEEKLKYDR